MKVLVCGGSRFKDKALLYRRLDALHAATPITLLINGGARGADYFASRCVRERRVRLQVHRATGKDCGVDAFMRLNGEMLEAERPDLVLAFPGGSVTADMIARAEAAGVRVERAAPDAVSD